MYVSFASAKETSGEWRVASGPPSPRGFGAGGEQFTDKQKAIIEILQEKGTVLLSELIREAGTTASPVKTLEKKGIVEISQESVRRDPLSKRKVLKTEPLTLMPEQKDALEQIKRMLDLQEPGVRCQVSGKDKRDGDDEDSGAERRTTDVREQHVQLLYGVTGSGKTEVYLQAIDHVLSLGKGAIVLVPEISLTPQTVERFQSRFGERIAVLHSHLSEGERHDEWHRIKQGDADIAIGARSAVFAPVQNLGLIVVDEEHESSYKQEDTPRYNARDVAVMRGHVQGCAVMLGSATPSLESWHNAQKGKYALSVLPKRADDRKMPHMQVVDMRIETERTGHVNVFSQELMMAIQHRLDNAQQTILFLNRRGFATSLVCPHCGHVVMCDQCSVSYTYHREDDRLHCHICGAERKKPQKCPSCQDPAFKFTGIGTQRVEKIIAKCFPHAKVQRMDADVTTKKDSYERILGDFKTGKTDILIGTQMIAKGLHFPNVTLVGVVYADLSLHMPDFRAGERTFQLLAQVAGRAGRGDVSGQVIIQTYTPHNPSVQAARRIDYEGFCDQEMAFRKELRYPPFAHVACITLRGPSDEKTSFYTASLARILKDAMPSDVVVSDAAPAPIARMKGNYRYQIMLRYSATGTVAGILKKAMKNFKLLPKMGAAVDIDAISLL
jgi:primosomal protein N' (replication factor Y)